MRTNDSGPYVVESNPIPLGKYLLLEEMGEGGITQLYRAKATGGQGPEKFIALKRILPHLSGIRELAKAFIDEAQIASLLIHPNVVHIYDVGNVEGSYYIAMEYLSGKDLRYIFNKSQEKGMPIRPECALFIIARICSGLDYAHKLADHQAKPLNIIHGDINPQNILVTYEGGVKIVDFAIIRATSKNTSTKQEMLKRKVAYMSPEQVLGEKIGPHSDIFSTGILLYEMITGKRMYPGDTMQALAKARKAEFDLPEVAMSGLPSKLYSILNKALARETAQRYQSCGEMLEEIEECLFAFSVHPTPQGLSEYMKELFGEEIEAEGGILNKATTVNPRPLPSDPTGPAPTFDRLPISPPEVHRSVDSKGIVSGPEGIDPPGSASGNPDSAAGVGLQSAEDVPEKVTATTERKENLRSKNHGFYYAALMGVFAVMVLGWAFWPKEKPVGSREGFSKPSAETDRDEKVLAKRYEEAKALREKAAGLAEKNPMEAKSLLLKAIELEPTNAQGHFQMGLTYMTLKNSPKAIAAYQKTIELDPKFPDAYFNLGYIYGTDKNYSKAEQMYSQVVNLAPSYLDEALFNLSLVQEKQGKRKQSIENVKRALQVNPKNEMAQKLLNKLKGVS